MASGEGSAGGMEGVAALWVLTSLEPGLRVTCRGRTIDAAIEALVVMADRSVCRLTGALIAPPKPT